MKLHEIMNVASAGDKTNLTGGKLPNVYRDDSTKVNKAPRKKKKDVYGTGGGSIGIQSTGDSGSTGGDSGGTGGDGGGTGGAGGAGV